jgi:hypothetical protein
MRIAVPVTAGQIPNHFGHGEAFLVASQGVTQVLAWGIPPHTAEGLDAGCGGRGHDQASGGDHHHP